MNRIVSLKNVYKNYYTKTIKTTALNDISLDINKGEFLAITGASGSGKSTLLNAIGLFSEINSGSIEINGTDILKLSQRKKLKYRRDFLGYVFQSFNLIPDLSVIENIMLPLKFRGIDKHRRLKIAETELASLELLARRDHYPSQLSGGQQQRVAIARTMACNPDIILADEPTGNLDEKTGKLVLDKLKEACSNETTIVMVTHSSLAANIADRRVHMSQGKLVK